MRLFALLLCAATLTLPGQDTAPPADFVKKSGEWMISTDATKRQTAYRSWLQLGPTAMKAYEKALRIARTHHYDKLSKVAGGTTPYEAHDRAFETLKDERKRVMKLILTDWHKDGKEIAKLRKEMEALTKLHEKVLKLAATKTEVFDKALEGSIQGLADTTRELERFEPKSKTIGMDAEDLRDWVIAGHANSTVIEDLGRDLKVTRKAIAKLAEVNKGNKEMGKWCSESMKLFASVLNRERDVCGLTPLLIEEKLSDAARGHSEDMARLGFFAHESPVPNKKTPWDRAALAGFTGNASGENIFMGSTSPQSAYDAWFGSDGHRFIMYMDGANLLGVGIAGSHWTMMTGSTK